MGIRGEPVRRRLALPEPAKLARGRDEDLPIPPGARCPGAPMRELRETIIEFRRSSMRAANAHQLLWDLSLSVGHDETLALLRQSESGNTSSFKLINHMLERSTGD